MIEDNGGKTGWPPGLLQDDSRGLSKWLSNKPDARLRVREALVGDVPEVGFGNISRDPYASEEETRALLVPDTRSSAQFQLDVLLDMEGAWEQGADPYTVLYRIAVKLIEEKT